MSEPFGVRLRAMREETFTETGKRYSQDAAARLFHVSLSTYCKWERGLHLPDYRSCLRLAELWPDLFTQK